MSEEWRAVPIPADLHEAVTEGVLTLADLLRKEATAEEAGERAFNAAIALDYDDPRYDEKHAAYINVYEAELAKTDALRKPISGAIGQVLKAMSAVEHFFIDIDAYDEEMEEDEGRRRECAASTCTTGTHAVVVTEVADLGESWDSEYTVAPYLVGRLGYTDEGARSAIKHVQHVYPETVLEGVHLDDAVRIKEELIRLGCTARVIEGKSRPSARGSREPILERVGDEEARDGTSTGGGGCAVILSVTALVIVVSAGALAAGAESRSAAGWALGIAVVVYFIGAAGSSTYHASNRSRWLDAVVGFFMVAAISLGLATIIFGVATLVAMQNNGPADIGKSSVDVLERAAGVSFGLGLCFGLGMLLAVLLGGDESPTSVSP